MTVNSNSLRTAALVLTPMVGARLLSADAFFAIDVASLGSTIAAAAVQAATDAPSRFAVELARPLLARVVPLSGLTAACGNAVRAATEIFSRIQPEEHAAILINIVGLLSALCTQADASNVASILGAVLVAAVVLALKAVVRRLFQRTHRGRRAVSPKRRS